jgi:hypothetical protein
MKSTFFFLSGFIFFIGCTKEHDIDTTPPPPPQGIKTISLDNAVEIRWFPSQADDLKGYKVWVNNTYEGRYQLIASVSTTYLADYGASNGKTYYYAVSAYDFNENESDLSKDVAYDTPRPEGYGVIITDTLSFRTSSGYGFAQYSVLDCYDLYTDVYFVNSGRPCLHVWVDTDIQDMGFTSSLDDISSSPTQGWTPSKSIEAIVGHTYVIWTVDDHYAKVRVIEVGRNQLKFDWAYQTAQGNPELRLGMIARNGQRSADRVRVTRIN